MSRIEPARRSTRWDQACAPAAPLYAWGPAGLRRGSLPAFWAPAGWEDGVAGRMGGPDGGVGGVEWRAGWGVGWQAGWGAGMADRVGAGRMGAGQVGAGRVGAGQAGWGEVGRQAVWGWAGRDAGGPGERVVQTFIQPKRVFVWRSKERAPKAGRIGNLEKSCRGLEKSCMP